MKYGTPQSSSVKQQNEFKLTNKYESKIFNEVEIKDEINEPTLVGVNSTKELRYNLKVGTRYLLRTNYNNGEPTPNRTYAYRLVFPAPSDIMDGAVIEMVNVDFNTHKRPIRLSGVGGYLIPNDLNDLIINTNGWKRLIWTYDKATNNWYLDKELR